MATRYIVRTHVVRKRYGFWRLLADFILVILTSGLWLLWMLVRFLRNNS